MRTGKYLVWQADATPTKPLCIGSSVDDSFSLTIWQNEDGSVKGVLLHEYKNDEIVTTVGSGEIPAEYVAFEENMSL